MNKKEQFKSFIKIKPELASFVNSGEMTWQKFYEMYDLYGEESSVWDKYKEKEESFKINDIIKNVDMSKIKDHISQAQKALDFVQELTSKNSTSNIEKIISTPRPLNKFFED